MDRMWLDIIKVFLDINLFPPLDINRWISFEAEPLIKSACRLPVQSYTI